MEALKEIEKDLLLALIKYHMPMELRHEVMKALPLAYNKWMEREIMTVGLKPENK